MFNKNIFELARKNNFFRKVLETGKHSQIVLMSIPVGDDIGEEVHHVDQTIVLVQGEAQAIMNSVTSSVHPYHLIFVPAGMQHNLKNIGSEELKLFTIYSPSQHKPGAIEKEKSEYESVE